MLRRALVGVGLVFLVATRLAAEELPATPEGFTWKKIDSVKAAFLIPDGWFFQEEKRATPWRSSSRKRASRRAASSRPG